MASVQGIGGVFIDSQDAGRLAGWYQEVLGIPMEVHPNGRDYYHVFSTRDAESGMLSENPVFAIYQAREPLAEQGRGFTLNLRVDDLDGFLEMTPGEGRGNRGGGAGLGAGEARLEYGMRMGTGWRCMRRWLWRNEYRPIRMVQTSATW